MKMVKMMAAFALVLWAPFSMAGAVIDIPVTIDNETMMASGNMKTARFSANEQEQIGCGTRASETSAGVFQWGFCQARIDEATTAFCSTDNPELVDKIRNINDYSFVSFRWNEEGFCTYLGFSTQSQYIPEYKDKKAK